jgi:hypothetical protein
VVPEVISLAALVLSLSMLAGAALAGLASKGA